MEQLISRSGASDPFKADLRRFADGGVAERIRSVRHAPRIKVLRVLAQLLSRESDLAIEHVVIDAWSGCSDFRGTIAVHCTDRVRAFRFRWDCSWRAEQQGWFDAFQLPDQIRAAREFGWQCFSEWEEMAMAADVAD